MTRGGRKSDSSTPQRRCIATGETRDPGDMIRFVLGPDGQVVPDIAGKLPGRGMWVTASRDAIDQAVKKKAFSRSAKTQVVANADLGTQVEELLARRVVELISLARKAGHAVCGFEKVRAALVDGTAAVLLQASDGSASQKGKLRPPNGKNTYFDCLSARELGLAFGRENVIHGALAGGGLTKRVVEEAARLDGLRGQGHEVRDQSAPKKDQV